jgi:UDP-N-acetylmuramoyl-L-alanyl-D-glutamate--2,6-diaminopimelate ligase
MVDFKGKIITNSIEGLELEIGGKNVWFKLIGDFNAYNLLAVFASAVLLGQDSDEVLTKLSALEGRLEVSVGASGSRLTAIVDYAHTPGRSAKCIGYHRAVQNRERASDNSRGMRG